MSTAPLPSMPGTLGLKDSLRKNTPEFAQRMFVDSYQAKPGLIRRPRRQHQTPERAGDLNPGALPGTRVGMGMPTYGRCRHGDADLRRVWVGLPPDKTPQLSAKSHRTQV